MARLFEPARPEELRDKSCLGAWSGGGDGVDAAAPGGGLAPAALPRWVEHGIGKGGAQVAGERVRAERLDVVLDPAAVKVHVLKVDLGGAETAALLGAGALLDSHLPCLILIEQYAAPPGGSGGGGGGGGGVDEIDSNALVRVLVARGYRFFRLGAGNSADTTPAATGASDPPLPPGLWEARLLVLAGACQRCASVSVPEPKCSW